MRALGLSVAPFALKVLFTWLPPTFAIYYWRNFFASKMAEYVFGHHARAASREMRELANDCRSLLEKSRIEAPALRQLYSAMTPMRRKRFWFTLQQSSNTRHTVAVGHKVA